MTENLMVHEVLGVQELMAVPGRTGDVTPEARDARDAAQAASEQAGSYAAGAQAALGTLDRWLADATQSPQGYATLADLQAARPAGSGLAVVLADGCLYYWDAKTGRWTKGSPYQSMGLTDAQQATLGNAVRRDRQIASVAQVAAPYDDLDTLPLNTVVTYAVADGVRNLPGGSTGTVLTLTGTSAASGAMQVMVTTGGVMWHRVAWGQPATWGAWHSPQATLDTQALLPSLSMFGRIGVIGDSYASGQTSFDDQWGTPTDSLRWPVMLARKWGVDHLDLAIPGISTRTWLTHDRGLARLNQSDPQDLYLFCLGINDYYGLGPDYLGGPDDMDTGADTFYGNTARILNAVQAKAPAARVIMLGLAATGTVALRFDAALKTIAAHYDLPFAEQTDDPLFTGTYYTTNLSGGHPTAPLYGAMALAIERLIQHAIIDNYPYFQRYGYTTSD